MTNFLREKDPKKIAARIAEVNTWIASPKGHEEFSRDFEKMEEDARFLNSMTEPKGPDVIFLPEI